MAVNAVPRVEPSLNGLAASATLNCLVGCAAGEVTGMALGTALGWSNLATVVLAIGLAFLFGYSLTSVPLLRSGLALAAVVPIALAADTVSITIMEAIDNAVVLAVPGAMAADLGDALFWGPLWAASPWRSAQPSSLTARTSGAAGAAVPGRGCSHKPTSVPWVEAAQLTTGSPEYLRLAKRAKWLSWVSLGYMAIEGIVAIAAGIVASSIALIGFGIDSAIEGFASVVIVWRFTGWRTLSNHAEERAQKLVAIQFFILAPYVGFEAVRTLVNGTHPEESVVGIALAASSLVLMPLLGRANSASVTGWVFRHSERGQAESAVRLPRCCAAGWPSRQRVGRGMVARPARRPVHRGSGCNRRPRGLARRSLLRSLRLGGPHRRSGRYSYERQPNRPVMTGRPRSTSTPQTGTTSPTTRPRRDTSHQAPANETPDRPARPLRHVNQAETVGVGTPPLRMAQGLKKSPGKKWTVGAGPPPFPPPPSGGGRSPSPVPRSRWVDSADLCARARRRVL